MRWRILLAHAGPTKLALADPQPQGGFLRLVLTSAEKTENQPLEEAAIRAIPTARPNPLPVSSRLDRMHFPEAERPF